MIKKLLLSALLLVVMLLVIVIGSTYFVLGTEPGFKWTTARLQNFDNRLTLAPTTGNLDTGIGTKQIRWEDEKLSINAEGIESRWRSGCLLKTHFCLEYLNIETLRVELKPNDNKPSQGDPQPIELPNILLPLRITADELQIERFELHQTKTGEPTEPLVIEDIRLSRAEASDSEIAFDKLAFRHRNYDVALNGNIKLKDDYPIDIDANVIATDVFETHDLTLHAQLDNTLTNLDVHAGLSGAVHVLLNADVQPLQPSLPLRGNLTWKQLGWPLDSREVFSSNNGRMLIAGSLDDYHLQLETQLEGAQVPDSDLKLKGQINTERALLPQVDLLLLDGAATASAAVSWQNGAHWVVDLVFRQLDPGKKWDQMQGRLDGATRVRGSADNGSWATTIDNTNISGELRGFPFQLMGEVARARDGNWLIPQINLANGANNLVLAGTAGEELDINLDMDFATIHTLVPSIAGNLKATANVSGPVSSPSLVLDANTSLLKAGDALFRELKIEANVQDAGQSASDIKIGIGTLTSSGQEFESIASHLRGTRNDHSLQLSIQGPQDTAVQLTTQGSLPDAPGSEFPSGNWRGQLQRASVNLPGHQLQLSKPTDINWRQDNKRIDISPHCWQDQSATLCLKEKVAGSPRGAAQVSLEGYRLQRLDQYLGDNTRLEGRLGADSEITWDTTKTDGFAVELSASIDNGVVVVKPANAEQKPLRLRYDNLNLKSRADPFTIVSELTLSSQQLGTARVDLTMNPKHPEKEILGNIDLQGLDVKLARPFLQNFNQVDGRVDASGDISGTLTNPFFVGKVILSDPVLLSDDLPLGIEGGQFTATINGQQAELDGEFDTGDGKLNIDGGASWQPPEWSATLNVNGDGLSIRQKPLISSEINPAIRVLLTPDKITVTGEVDIPAALIDIKERDVAAASLSEDVIIIEDEDSEEQKQAREAAGSGPDIETNITVNLGEQVNLQGYGLNARLTGDIRVNKTNDDPPQLGGQIKIAEGFYKSYGQNLEVTEGQILFIGPIEQTTLDIKAVRTIDGEERVAGLRVDGPIADPAVTLFTEPADKTEDSILSYIVLGRDIGSSTTTEESTLLAQAAIALTLRQGRGFATGFAESLGISDFQIDASGSGDDTQVVVSGRLSRKLLLRYGRSVFAPDQTLFLRYDINKRLYLEAAQGIERAVDLFYSYSF